MTAHISPSDLRRTEQPLHVLFIGPALAEASAHFKRADEIVRCDHADDLATGLEMVLAQTRAIAFDCVILDVRAAHTPAEVAGLASLNACGTLALLVLPEMVEIYSQIAGIDELLVHPIERMHIVETVVASAQNRKADAPALVEIPRGFSFSEPMNAPSVSEDAVVEERVMKAQKPEVHGQIDRAMEALEELHSADVAAPVSAEAAPVITQTPVVDANADEKTGRGAGKKNKAKKKAAKKQRAEAKPTLDGVPTIVADAMAEVEEATVLHGKPVQAPLPTEPAAVDPVAMEVSTGEPAVVQPKAKSAVTKGFESSLSLIAETDQSVWQRFVPLANFFYKKLAIIVLTTLFLTFVAYGAMIVFFMGSSSWSLPFELSRGHVLVEKIDRDLSSMSLRRNQVRQDLTVATAEGVTADRELRDGQLQLSLTQRTIEEELRLQGAQQLEIRQHISRLKEVIKDFNTLNGKGGFAKNLETAFDKRLITRKSLNSGTLAVLETLHRIATVQNEISVKQLELRRVDRRLEFLQSLLSEIDQPELRVITSAGSDLAHLAREVIEAKNRISTATKSRETVNKRITRLNNSDEVISANIASLESTPAARARFQPVMVLFVPYQNAASMEEGTELYNCLFSIVICSRVGQVGKPVEGETTAVHPLFSKPLRGNFVEAQFDNPDSVRKELMHAGRGPLWF